MVLRIGTDDCGVERELMTRYGIIATIGGQYGRGGPFGQNADELMGCEVLLFAKIHINQLGNA